jgi:phosphatidate cytidylyltransferase
MLAHRLATGSSLIALFLVILFVDETWLAPWFPLWVIAVVLVMGEAARELVGLLERTSARPSGGIVVGGVLALVAANVVPHVIEHASREASAAALDYDAAAPLHVLAWPLLAFAGVLMTAFLIQGAQFTRPGGTMATLSGSILAIAYVGLLGSFVVQTRWLPGPHHGVVPLLMLVATAKGADVGAYTLGRLAGRHKLWPRLSPNKTREGAAGGLALAVVAALTVAFVGRRLGHPSLDWPAAAGFGVVVGLFAQLGDLMESMIKRDCERKDASDTLPGFGGVLDVIDSLLFAGPVAYAYWLLFGP